MASVNGIRAGRAYVELGADNSKLNQALKQAEASVKAFGSKAAEIGTGVAKAGLVVAAPMALASKIFAGFDDQMRLTQAVTGSTGKQFDMLTEKAKLLGRTTSFTAQEVASGMTALGRMGFVADEIDASIASVMDLSRATGTEIPLATDIAGNTMRQFGLDASNMTRICDVLTATANGSAQTLEDLGESLKYAAPVAKQANLSLEDTAVLLGSLANFGIKGTMAGTSLRNMLVQLANKDIRQKLKDTFDVDAVDASGNLRNLATIITEIGQAASNMPNAERLSIFDELFGKRPLASSLSLAGADFTALSDAIRGSGDVAAATAKQMDAGLGGAIRITLSAAEGLALALGAQLAPDLQAFGESLQNNIGRITEWVKRHKDAIVQTAKLAGTLLTAGAAMYALGKAVSVCYSVMSGMRMAGVALTKAIGAITGATSALIAKQEAEAVLAVKNEALKKALAAASLSLTGAQAAQANSALELAMSEQAEAAAAVQATGSTYALSAAMSTLMIAGAVITVIAALGYAAVKMGSACQEASEKAKSMSDAAKEQTAAHEQLRSEHSQLFDELQRLSEKENLTNEEFERGKAIAQQLQNAYGNLGIQCDETSRTISGMTEAQRAFNAAQQEQRRMDLENQNQKLNDELKDLEKEEKDLLNPTSFSAVRYGIRSFFSLGSKENETERLASIKQRRKDIGIEQLGYQNQIDLIKASQAGRVKDAGAPTRSPSAGANPAQVASAVNAQYGEQVDPAVMADTQADIASANADIADLNDANAQVVEAQVDNVGSFDALEAFDMSNDWERQAAEEQAKKLEDIKESAESIVDWLTRTAKQDELLI